MTKRKTPEQLETRAFLQGMFFGVLICVVATSSAIFI